MKKNKVIHFRFSYFTDKYLETFHYYQEVLGLKLEHAWDRNSEDKGALFKIGPGLIEILHRPMAKHQTNKGLDYRPSQGVFMGIQVNNIDDLYTQYQKKGIIFKQEITDQPWGHRSFSIIEPNGLVLFYYQENF